MSHAKAYRARPLQIGTTPPATLPVSRALVAGFCTTFAIAALISISTEEVPTGLKAAQQAFLYSLSAIFLGTALVLRSRFRAAARRRRSLLDPLTRLPGMQLFHEDVARIVARSRKRRSLVTVVTIDCGGIAVLADRHGAVARDRLIIEVGERLRRAVRTRRIVARTGDMEFSILLWSNTSAVSAAWVAETALDELDLPFLIGEDETTLSTRAGIGHCIDADCTTELLIETAATALKRAKTSVRSRYAVLYTDMLAEAETAVAVAA
jgi:diguanylate cyclase (GGDEF)-like protein